MQAMQYLIDIITQSERWPTQLIVRNEKVRILHYSIDLEITITLK